MGIAFTDPVPLEEQVPKEVRVRAYMKAMRTVQNKLFDLECGVDEIEAQWDRRN